MNNGKKKELILNCADECELIESLKQSGTLYWQYRELNREWQERFKAYCLGRKTLPVTYDPFFKRVFHPDVHPERLSRLISSLLDIPVRVVRLLPSEETMLDGGVLLILDILVELEDGALANVEVQKVPYLFPGERISCYSSDLVLRQYSRVRGEKKNKFRYGDLKKVYTIVIFEKSPAVFHKRGMHYLHRGKTVFDTKLELELLQEYCLLALDVFREKPYPKDRSEQSAWIAFLATDSVETAQALAEDYPWLADIYEEMAGYLHKPEEVLGMFSEALKIMDQNTVQYMVELQQQQLEEARNRVEEMSGELEDTRGQLEDTQGQLTDTQEQLKDTQGQLKDTQGQLAEMSGELEDTKGRLDAFMKTFISNCRKQGHTNAEIRERLQNEYGLSGDEADRAMRQFCRQ